MKKMFLMMNPTKTPLKSDFALSVGRYRILSKHLNVIVVVSIYKRCTRSILRVKELLNGVLAVQQGIAREQYIDF
jgi:hypothetical protein